MLQALRSNLHLSTRVGVYITVHACICENVCVREYMSVYMYVDTGEYECNVPSYMHCFVYVWLSVYRYTRNQACAPVDVRGRE